MMNVLSLALRELGPGPLLRMAAYRAAVRSGWYRWRTPARTWEELPFPAWLRPDVPCEPAAYLHWRADHSPQPRFDPGANQSFKPCSDRLLEKVNHLQRGRFTLFGGLELELGFPPAWNYLPAVEPGEVGQLVAQDRHWSAYHLERLSGDVKLLWEPARFAWAFDLVRAYLLTSEEVHADAFWKLFQSWREASPPNTGLHWHSAQEVAYRTIALSYAVDSLHSYWEGHPDRLQRVIEVIAAGAARIPPTMIYARAQDNNHLLLECAALLTAGLLFPELEQAAEWARVGRVHLVAALRRQIFEDGGYIQHSSSYHRLALQGVLWASLIAQRSGSPLPDDSLARLETMIRWIEAWIEPATGSMPNFGPNDGAQLLPLSDQPHADYRPTIQAAALLLEGRRRLPSGGWDDLAFWLGLLPADESNPLSPEPSPTRVDFPQCGLFRFGQRGMRGSLRAVRFVNRPGHSDQMHVDLWWNGYNLACDSGTYLYNAPPPWENPFSGAWCHNSILIDDYEPMLAAGRFLWLDWSAADLVCRWESPDGQLEWIEVERRGFRPRGIVHRRSILACSASSLIVADSLQGSGEHTVRINWLLPDLEWKGEGDSLRFEAPNGTASLRVEGSVFRQAIYRAGTSLKGGLAGLNPELCGWRSPTYAVRQPALQVIHDARMQFPARILSTWQLGLTTHDLPRLTWVENPAPGRPGISEIAWDGRRWEVECTSS